MNSIVLPVQTSSRTTSTRDLCYVARQYRDRLKEMPELREFLLLVRNRSGAAVAHSVWQVIEMVLERTPHIKLSRTPELRSIMSPLQCHGLIHCRDYWLSVFDRRIIRG